MTLDGHTTKKQVNHKWKNIHVHVIIGWEHEQTLNLFGAIIISSLGGGGRGAGDKFLISNIVPNGYA